MNKDFLTENIENSNLSPEVKAELKNLLKNKTYGLVWENKPENVEQQLQNELPVLKEVQEKEILAKNLPKNQLFD